MFVVGKKTDICFIQINLPEFFNLPKDKMILLGAKYIFPAKKENLLKRNSNWNDTNIYKTRMPALV